MRVARAPFIVTVLICALNSASAAALELDLSGTISTANNIVPEPGGWFSTLSESQRESLYWVGDWETGDTSQWDNGQPWVSGPGTSKWKLSTNPVHSGNFAMSTTINTTDGPAGVRWPRRDVPGMNSLPTEAYYSTWLRFDNVIDAPWYNLMQWKHATPDGSWSDPVWSIDIGKNSDGKDYYYLYSYIGDDGNYLTPGIGDKGDSTIPIPIGQWTHLETYYKWSSDTTGAIDVYQDGQLIFEQTGVRTKFVHADALNKPLQWTINAYGDDIFPSPSTIFFDDAAISATRLGGVDVPATIPGDFDSNGSVDTADYVAWRQGFGEIYTQNDYNVWRAHFGQAAGTGANATVPEPASLVLTLAAAIMQVCFLSLKGRQRSGRPKLAPEFRGA